MPRHSLPAGCGGAPLLASPRCSYASALFLCLFADQAPAQALPLASFWAVPSQPRLRGLLSQVGLSRALGHLARRHGVPRCARPKWLGWDALEGTPLSSPDLSSWGLGGTLSPQALT